VAAGKEENLAEAGSRRLPGLQLQLRKSFR
jgi:hypothetical protein